MNKTSIMLVEDDESLSFVIKDNLSLNGYDVIHYADGALASKSFTKGKFDLCLLDVMLPAVDGFTLGKEIRKKDSNVPILYLTAKSMQEDKLEGFKSGGDDYITKPFSMEELIFRIEVFLKRKLSTSTTKQNFKIGEYDFNYSDLSLTYKGEIKNLTQKEADVLRFFCLNKQRVVKRDEILKEVWGDDDYFLGRSLDVFISKLRKYLAKDSNVSIANRHGIGFELVITIN
ncbi:response regulator transcription factor [Fulvivirga lutea]|uniref:Response regulator transcription factor n=1 Tax=Fulvivirga lutea TaxID=2810512 RepID=A0A974WGT4_9BACT|nr:response regulator transcription factor [Fulvivirga lutea]QSE98056.1 response regulator transcription factor [Fulvivirga lutea]